VANVIHGGEGPQPSGEHPDRQDKLGYSGLVLPTRVRAAHYRRYRPRLEAATKVVVQTPAARQSAQDITRGVSAEANPDDQTEQPQEAQSGYAPRPGGNPGPETMMRLCLEEILSTLVAQP